MGPSTRRFHRVCAGLKGMMTFAETLVLGLAVALFVALWACQGTLPSDMSTLLSTLALGGFKRTSQHQG
jgi:hypothetical protein